VERDLRSQPAQSSKDFTGVNCQYAFDFNGDGWTDILTGPPRATLYINPKGENRRWDKYEVVTGITSEITVLRDVNGDGVPDLVYASDGAVRYATADRPTPVNPGSSTRFPSAAMRSPWHRRG